MKYPHIARWLNSWMQQLEQMPPGDYRVLVDELADDACAEWLAILDAHLAEASEACGNFAKLLAEKGNLPPNARDANRTIFDKLAEVRAVCGLHRLGFTDLEFVGTPDLRARRCDKTYLIDVTRFGRSEGKRADIWDERRDLGELLGPASVVMGTIKQGGPVNAALSEAVYREIEGKAKQQRAGMLAHQDESAVGLVWISLGRDYLTAGAYELPGVGATSRMPRTMGQALKDGFDSIKETGAYGVIEHAVMSLGRDNDSLLLGCPIGTGWSSSGTLSVQTQFVSSAFAKQLPANGGFMKQDSRPETEEMEPEYDIRGGVRGKYLDRYRQGTNVILLEPDVAAVFHDSESVNQALRLLIDVGRSQTS